MRTTSYAIAAVAVICTTVFTVLSLTRIDWVVANYRSDPVNSSYQVKYGLTKVCERLVIGRKFEAFDCRKFPTRDEDSCDDKNRFFCAAWSSAGYAVELAIGFGALSLAAIIFGVSTHSRRRRIWRAVAGLVVLHSAFQLAAFALVLDMHRASRFPITFDNAKLGPAFAFNTVAWVFGVITAIGVIATGMAADRGQRWAAGSRAYQPILGN
ncbi:hypothetical protein C8F04DRAFT_1065097 [Mycena alexandri]|uniref:Uncharacterized protein n=1 Tax=Mycena alexandri TaxID=1745969 RepID=A0AAD6TGA9_9AGAR|nr:hypothetical protein C8F04DRAFT_1065097 [Mycena alexandri]